MLRYLEVLRATRRATVSYLAARLGVYEAWSELEQACGAPLLQFAHEPGSGARAAAAGPAAAAAPVAPVAPAVDDALNQGDA